MSKVKAEKYGAFLRQRPPKDHCFLCGDRLTNRRNNRSAEHVFPEWLLHRYDLWNTKLTLLNGTHINYKSLTIPSCAKCNNEHLGKLERDVQVAHDNGYEGISQLDSVRVYQWLAKLIYGILSKETQLIRNRRSNSKRSIVLKKHLRDLKTLHLFLQSIRIQFVFHEFTPYSLFIFQTETFNDERDFDYMDCIPLFCIALRLKGVGIIAVLEDNGTQYEMFSNYMKRFAGFKLHPLQFNELFAKVVYKASLLNRTPKYISVESPRPYSKVDVIALPLAGMAGGAIYDEWDQETYARYLHFYWRTWNMPWDKIFFPPDKVYSALTDPEGNIPTVVVS